MMGYVAFLWLLQDSCSQSICS